MCPCRLERVSARSVRVSRSLDASVSTMIAYYLFFGAARSPWQSRSVLDDLGNPVIG